MGELPTRLGGPASGAGSRDSPTADTASRSRRRLNLREQTGRSQQPLPASSRFGRVAARGVLWFRIYRCSEGYHRLHDPSVPITGCYVRVSQPAAELGPVLRTAPRLKEDPTGPPTLYRKTPLAFSGVISIYGGLGYRLYPVPTISTTNDEAPSYMTIPPSGLVHDPHWRCATVGMSGR
jgi:hypothetical protein